MATARTGPRHPGRAPRPARAPRHHPSASRQCHRRAAGNGSHATSTAASCSPPRRSRCSSARTTRAKKTRDSCGHVHGEQHHLEQHALAAGTVQLNGAPAHWWVLDDNPPRAPPRKPRFGPRTGHAVAVHGGDDLPDRRAAADPWRLRAASGLRHPLRLRARRAAPQAVRPDRMPRAQHRPHAPAVGMHQPLPWARWGEEFTAAMPDEIRQLQERAANADCGPARREANPRPHQRDHAALQTEPLPPTRTAPPATLSGQKTNEHRHHSVTCSVASLSRHADRER